MDPLATQHPRLAPSIAIVVSCVGLLSACGLGTRNQYVPPPPPPASPIVVSAQALTFAPTPVGASAPAQQLTLTNTSSQAVSINIIRVSSSDSFNRTTDCGHQLLAGQSCTVSITFNPQSPRPLSARVEVFDRGFQPVTILLSGTGTARPEPSNVQPPSESPRS